MENEIIYFQMEIDDIIIEKGLDSQGEVNSLGIELYKVYDEMLWQKKNKKNIHTITSLKIFKKIL